MTLLLFIHALITLAMIGVILLQKSEGGGFGLGAGNATSFFTVRGSANFLTRTTAVLAGLFLINCLVLTVIAAHRVSKANTIIELPPSPSPKGTGK